MTNFKEVADRIVALQEKKNKDYGDAFANLCEEWGSTALMYPLSIKIQRLKTLFSNNTQQIKNEALTDTLLDIMGYAGMGIMALENGTLKTPKEKGIGMTFDGLDISNLVHVPMLVFSNDHSIGFSDSFEAAIADNDSINSLKNLFKKEEEPERGKLILLIGARGVGKTTYKNIICEKYPEEFQAPVSATTRAPREGEAHGKDYYFIDELEFESALEMNNIIEAEMIQGTLYGSVKASIDTILESGKNAITEVGLEGVDNLRDIYGDDCNVYYIYNNEEVIAKQLINRDTSSLSAFFMMKGFDKFDYKATELCDWLFNANKDIAFHNEVTTEEIAAELRSYINCTDK